MKWLKWLGVIGVFILLLFAQHRWFPRVEYKPRIVRDTIWEKKDSLVYRDSLIPYEVIVPNDTIYIPADTLELIALYKALSREYNTETKYEEHLDVDSIGEIVASFSVVQNKPKDFTLGYNLNYPTIIETRTVLDSRPFLTVGLMFGENTVPLVGVGWKNVMVEVGWNNDVYLGVRYMRRFNLKQK